MLRALQDRSEMKEAIILIAYAGLLYETLTPITMSVVLMGAILVWLRIRPNTITRNVISLGVFGTYWLTYGKVIDPEVGLNFLTIIMVLKLLEKESVRDRYMIFFGIMLLVGAGTLFQRSLLYVFFFISSFFILMHDFYGNLKLPFRIGDLAKILLWILPLTAFLFVFAPRVMNPLGMEGAKPSEGEVGYTPDVNISQIETLSMSEKPVFQVEMDAALPLTSLYWRGNTLSYSDGWNWPLAPKDKPISTLSELQAGPLKTGITQNFRMLSRQDFLFSLDHPQEFRVGNKILGIYDTKTVGLSRYQWFGKYSVTSTPTGVFENPEERLVSYKHVALNKIEKKWVHDNFTASTMPALADQAQAYFIKSGFTYSLSPGKIPDFLTFMNERKTGFCSHYASALGLILRAKGIPSRLVSGFMGGNFNQFANFYLITQNDAHVWVEAFYNERWHRIDPTGWIAPERLSLGGEAYLGQVSSGALGSRRFSFRPAWLTDAQKWFGQWDFKFYQWLEEMDYYEQESLFQKLNFDKKWLYSLIPLVIAVFMGFYTLHLSRNKKASSELVTLWVSFQERLKKRGLSVPLLSLSEGEALIEASQDKEKGELLSIWKKLTEVTFKQLNEEALRDLKKRIKKI